MQHSNTVMQYQCFETDWQPVQGSSCLDQNVCQEKLQPQRENVGVENGYMDGCVYNCREQNTCCLSALDKLILKAAATIASRPLVIQFIMMSLVAISLSKIFHTTRLIHTRLQYIITPLQEALKFSGLHIYKFMPNLN